MPGYAFSVVDATAERTITRNMLAQMLFVINKSEFQHAISIVRDDRSKRAQGLAGSFMRLEAKGEQIGMEVSEASARIPATVYEEGVLFLKVTLLRRLLQRISGDKFLTIQVVADGLLLNNICLPLEANEMLLYADPNQAPKCHPSAAPQLPPPPPAPPKPASRQGRLWVDFGINKMRDRS